MARISVTTADEQPLSAQYAAPTATLDGRALSRRVSPDGFSLWLITAEIDAAARLHWDADHGDEAVFVRAGELRIGDRTCTTGGVLVVESGTTADVEVVQRSEATHLGPANPAPRGGGRGVHVIAPRGSAAREEATPATRQ